MRQSPLIGDGHCQLLEKTDKNRSSFNIQFLLFSAFGNQLRLQIANIIGSAVLNYTVTIHLLLFTLFKVSRNNRLTRWAIIHLCFCNHIVFRSISPDRVEGRIVLAELTADQTIQIHRAHLQHSSQHQGPISAYCIYIWNVCYLHRILLQVFFNPCC